MPTPPKTTLAWAWMQAINPPIWAAAALVPVNVVV